jgi:hypothetical protein
VSHGRKSSLTLADDGLDLALGLGAVGATCARRGAKRHREVDPFGGEDRPLVGRLTDHEDRVAVGEDLLGRPAELVHHPWNELERGGARPVDGNAHGNVTGIPEDPDQRIELDDLGPERPRPELTPVHLGLDARFGLEADDRLGVLLGAQASDPARDARVAARIPELGDLAVKSRGAQCAAHPEPAPDV